MRELRTVLVVFVVVSLCATGATAGFDARTSDSAVEPVPADRAASAETPGAGERPAAMQGFGQDAEQNESEPNDGPADANQIQGGSSVAGTVSTPEDIDSYTLNVSEGDTLRVNVTRESGSGLLAVGVIGPNGFLGGVVAEPGNTTRFAQDINETGQYFVVVSSAASFGVDAPDANGTGPYVLEVGTKSIAEDGGEDCPFGFCPPDGTTREVSPTTTEVSPPDTTVAQRTTQGGPSPSDGGTESEPNDQPSQANSLSADQSVQGEVSSTDDIDWYAVQLNEGQEVRVDLARSSGSGTLVYAGVHPTGALLGAAEVNPGETTSATLVANESGTYYFPVFSSPEDPGTGQYQLTISSAQVEPGGVFDDPNETTIDTGAPDETTIGSEDSTEPNDDPQSATSLQSGVSAQGEIAEPSDQDWYRIDLSGGDLFQSDLLHAGGDGTLEVTYYYPNGSEMQSMTAEGENSNAILTGQAPDSGTYYVRVISPDGSARYQLTMSVDSATPSNGGDNVSDPNEPNDDPQSATPLRVGEEVQGEIEDVADTDVFRVNAREGGTVTFHVTNHGDRQASLDLSVVGTHGDSITFDGQPTVSATPGRWNLTISNVTPTGTMYLVVAAGNGTGSYTVSAEVANGTETSDGVFDASTERERNDDPESATAIQKETAVRGEITDASDVDWFSFEANEGDLMIARLQAANGAASLAYGLFDSQRRTFAENLTVVDAEAQIQAIAGESGTHYVAVVSGDGGTGAYTLIVRTPGAQAETTSALGGPLGSAVIPFES